MIPFSVASEWCPHLIGKQGEQFSPAGSPNLCIILNVYTYKFLFFIRIKNFLFFFYKNKKILFFFYKNKKYLGGIHRGKNVVTESD